jgi:hypothetical protein
MFGDAYFIKRRIKNIPIFLRIFVEQELKETGFIIFTELTASA